MVSMDVNHGVHGCEALWYVCEGLPLGYHGVSMACLWRSARYSTIHLANLWIREWAIGCRCQSGHATIKPSHKSNPPE
eukprot:7283014-Pyramimonas_sp.AAC.1